MDGFCGPGTAPINMEHFNIKIIQTRACVGALLEIDWADFFQHSPNGKNGQRFVFLPHIVKCYVDSLPQS